LLYIYNFKKVNDRYGHRVGDEVLSCVASRIKKSLRQGDVAGRYGGEEFIVLVLGVPPDYCFNIAERIRQEIARQPIEVGQITLKLTISLGLVSIDPDQALSLDELINCADQAMYSAKQRGRNRVFSWNQIQTPADPKVTLP